KIRKQNMFPLLPLDHKLKRRGRPCASERYNNEILEQKLTSLINSDDDFTKSNIMPFIVKRQRRVRANDRERNRMQTLNEALDVLKDHLPIDFLVSEFGSDLDNSGSSETKKSRKKCGEDKLTKIDTLKLATKYIGLLTDILNEENGNYRNINYTNSSGSSSSSPIMSAWSQDNRNLNYYNHVNKNTMVNFSTNPNNPVGLYSDFYSKSQVTKVDFSQNNMENNQWTYNSFNNIKYY
ncbi:unnamed protein product, partial [Brachionus calyciflorus]